jgi:Ca2+-binding EF-hand superfamily protein
MSLSDQQLREIVDVVFGRYDTDNNGTLDRNEVKVLISDVFTQLDMARLADPQEIDKFID